MNDAIQATAKPPLPGPVPFLRAARAVFDLALEGMVWSKRNLVMAALIGLPILLSVFFRAVLASKLPSNISGFDLYGIVVALYYVRNVLPLAALFHASALIADEVEGKTITYLLSRPVTRLSIFVGKFAAYLVAMLTLALPSLVITYFLLTTTRGLSGAGQSLADLWRDAGAVALTLAVYGALFALLGVLLKRPTIPGLVFLLGWELLANLPGYMPRFTLTAYLRSLIRHRPPDEGLSQLFGQVLPVGESLLALAGIFIFCIGLAGWIFSRREYVLEQ